MDFVAATLSRLEPDDLFPFWCAVDDLLQAGTIDPSHAWQLKIGIFELMERWRLKPDDLVSPLLDPVTPIP
jgi:hypothetical protein